MYFIVLRYICIINKISLDYLSTNEDAKLIEYMEIIKDENMCLSESMIVMENDETWIAFLKMVSTSMVQ